MTRLQGDNQDASVATLKMARVPDEALPLMITAGRVSPGFFAQRGSLGCPAVTSTTIR